MHPTLERTLHESDYEQLPEGIRSVVTAHEYLYMPDSLKATLVQTETEPETEL